MSQLALERIAESKKTKAKTLELRNCDIATIPQELFDCVWLDTLYLGANQISDISCLKSLVRLERLILSSNQISDISCLKDLTQLKSLDLNENQISDISCLKNLVRLEVLKLDNNHISDVSFLKGLIQLKDLSANRNQISDLSFVKSLVRLESLYLSGGQISDISCLKSLVLLKNLDLGANEISDISCLKDLIQLEYLHLNENQISDISCLKSLILLDSLGLDRTKISDISYLKNLVNLTFLSLDENQISDISYLKDLTQLEVLILRDNQISDTSFLRDLIHLRSLDLSNNQIFDIEPLLPLLKQGVRLRVRNNPIIDPPVRIIENSNDAIIAYFEKRIGVANGKVIAFKFENFRGITETEVRNIPPKTQWLFLTGENGFGKTSILQALAKGLTGEGYIDSKIDKDKTIGQKVVAYGSSRLQVSAGTSTEMIAKYSAIDSLLSNETPLINIEERLKDWDRNYEKGFLQLETLFKALLPRLGRVAVKFNNATKSSEVKYYETDDEGLFYGDGVTFEQLAAGYKNIIAMIGDLVYRLSLHQDVKSLSDLGGIVLIDEIELHLHVKYQKIFIEKLTELFPKIQFIVSTHSPIPLLGAPQNSVIVNVSRTTDNGIEAKLLDIDFSVLTPNAILSSPIFGFQSIVPVSKSPNKMVRTEDNFQDIGLNDNLKQNINDFLSSDNQQELLNLINAK